MNEKEREICRAPAGMHRIVHRDPSDNDCNTVGDFPPAEARTRISKMLPGERAVTEVYDFQGARIDCLT